MAKISFNEAQTTPRENSDKTRIGFFSLKNDGDVAIVRIMCKSTEDFEILTTHQITLDGKYRSVNCIRDPKEPTDKCPMCNAGKPVKTKIFVKMIQYITSPEGKVVPTPVVWERPANVYGTKLASYISEYGDLSNMIFKIKRNGKAGDMNTSYEFMPASPAMYNDETCTKIDDAFDNYRVLGRIVMDKTADELNQFLTTGAFPEEAQTKDTNNDSRAIARENVHTEARTAEPTERRMPWEREDSGTIVRPSRTY